MTLTDNMDVTEFKKIIQDNNQEIAQLKTTNNTLKAKITWFEEQFKLLKHKHFSKSSEKQTGIQLQLFDEDETVTQEESSDTETITTTRKKPIRPDKLLDTSHLPREKRIIDLSDIK